MQKHFISKIGGSNWTTGCFSLDLHVKCRFSKSPIKHNFPTFNTGPLLTLTEIVFRLPQGGMDKESGIYYFRKTKIFPKSMAIAFDDWYSEWLNITL